MSDHPKGSGALFPNKEKTQQNHPDFRGNVELTKEQLDRLYEMGRSGAPVKLQVSAWKRRAKQSGQPFISMETEAYWRDAPQQGGGGWGGQQQPQQQRQQQGGGGWGGSQQPQQQRPQQGPPQQPQQSDWGSDWGGGQQQGPQQGQQQGQQQGPQQGGWGPDDLIDDDIPFN